MGRDMDKRRQWYRDRYATKIRAQRIARYEQNKAAGICTNCGKRPALSGIIVCDVCVKHRQRGSNAYNRRLRMAVFNAYGRCCACCGEDEPLFLSIDHVNGDGAEHRRSLTQEKHSADMYAWLVRNNFPPGFQILCHNCNMGTWRNGGVCPHKMKRDADNTDCAREPHNPDTKGPPT